MPVIRQPTAMVASPIPMSSLSLQYLASVPLGSESMIPGILFQCVPQHIGDEALDFSEPSFYCQLTLPCPLASLASYPKADVKQCDSCHCRKRQLKCGPINFV